MAIRNPAVAGQFYPGTENSLKKSIEKMIEPIEKKIVAKGVVSPHAGYVYSGKVAAQVFSAVKIPKTVVILGPNHTGAGKPYAIMTSGKWSMPMGEVGIAEDLAKKLLDRIKILDEDSVSHKYEHSLEVQVPFIQYFQKDAKIVPIAIGGYSLKEFTEIGEGIACCIKEYDKNVLIVASSDMTHYEQQEEANRKDNLAIEPILKLDPEEMLQRVEKYNISMCGFAPTAIMLIAAKVEGAKHAKLIKYMTSGDTTGDLSAVVGYAGVVVY